jgi:hypothetical protein
MQQEVWCVVITCPLYIRYNMVATNIGNRITSIETTEPTLMLGINNLGPLEISSENNGYCLVGFDHFTKAAAPMPVVAMNTVISIYFIETAESMLGDYKKIITYSVPYITSSTLKKWCQKKGAELKIATLANLEANGCCEGFIRTF